MQRERPAAHILDTLIIGAGSSGLTAAFHLNQQGISPVILEAGHSVGGSWRERHPQLALNTHRALSGLPGMAIPVKAGSFVHKDRFVRYLEKYADWLQRSKDVEIHFNTRIQRVRRTEDAWQVDTTNGTWLSHHLIVATGPDRIPHTPHWPGLSSYRGVHRHAADFGAVEQYENQRVLIVGAGNSAIDIANHLLSYGCCRSIAISSRSGGHLLPKTVAGLPLQLLAPLLRWLPLSAQDRLLSLIGHFVLGDLGKQGYNEPLQGAATRLQALGRAPAIDEGCAAAIRSGKVRILPAIEHFNDEQILFTDDHEESFDCVLFATGYRSGLEKMLHPLNAVDNQGKPHFHAPKRDPHNPGLWLFGMQGRLEGNLHARHREARSLARQISKHLRWPSLMPGEQAPGLSER